VVGVDAAPEVTAGDSGAAGATADRDGGADEATATATVLHETLLPLLLELLLGALVVPVPVLLTVGCAAFPFVGKDVDGIVAVAVPCLPFAFGDTGNTTVLGGCRLTRFKASCSVVGLAMESSGLGIEAGMAKGG
jgi:hypothetical protein